MQAGHAAESGVATVRGEVALSGNASIHGSLRQLSAEQATLSGNASIRGDLYSIGTPQVETSGRGRVGATLPGQGVAEPRGHLVLLSGNALIERLRPRTDAVSLSDPTPPAEPQGVRSVSLSSRAQSPGNFATLLNLTLSGNAGSIVVPPGAYGAFVATGNTALVLGVPGGLEPVRYDFQRLTLSGNARLDVVGPVVVRLRGPFSPGGRVGSEAHPEWLSLQVSEGAVTLSGNAGIFGKLSVPLARVTVTGNARLTGGFLSQDLTVQGNGVIRVLFDLTPSTVVTPVEAPLPYAANFERQENYRLGSLDGQLGWRVREGTANVVETPAFDGDQAIQIVPGGIAGSFERLLAAPAQSPVFVDLFLRSAADRGAGGTTVQFADDPIRFIADGSQATLLPPGLADAALSNLPRARFATEPNGSAGWVRLTARLDGVAQTADYYLNGLLAHASVPVAPGARVPRQIRVGGDGDRETFVDSIYAGYENPLFADADHDGLDDAWEVQGGLDPDSVAREADADGDGLNNLREFLFGTRADQRDTDADGADDAAEIGTGRNPLKGLIPDAAGTLRLNIHRPN